MPTTIASMLAHAHARIAAWMLTGHQGVVNRNSATDDGSHARWSSGLPLAIARGSQLAICMRSNAQRLPRPFQMPAPWPCRAVTGGAGRTGLTSARRSN